MTNLKLNQQELSWFQKTGQIVQRFPITGSGDFCPTDIDLHTDGRLRIFEGEDWHYCRKAPAKVGDRLNVEVDKATLEAEVTEVDCKQEEGDWFFNVTFKLIK